MADNFDEIKNIVNNNAEEKIEDFIEETKDKTIKYNKNPFIPKGRMKTSVYFVYMIIFNLIIKIADYDLITLNNASISASLNYFVISILFLFIFKNRLFDITLSEKKSWWISSIMYIVLNITAFFNMIIYYIIGIPFGFLLLLLPSKLEIEENKKTESDKENKTINYKNGFTRIFLAIGYLLFILIGLLIGSNHSFFAAIIGSTLGFFIFKYLLISIKWIIKGFKNE